MEEIWKTIEQNELYQISNFGRVKSLKFGKEKILKLNPDGSGYLKVDFNNKTKHIHQLVASAFLNHIPSGHKLVVNHKDFNRLNNNVLNLEIITNRENTNMKHIKSSSKYTGVCWHKKAKKWLSRIVINGKQKHLGYFTNEIDAFEMYQKSLNKI